jgi:hypothetical protein
MDAVEDILIRKIEAAERLKSEFGLGMARGLP